METENREIADQEKTENLETFLSSSSSPTLSINSEKMVTENPEIADQEKTENLEDFPSSSSSPTLSINSEKTATENPEIADQKDTQILEIAGPEKPEIDVEICARTRLEIELKEFNKNPPANVSCGPISDEDMFHWQGIIIGPADTPLEDSLFHLSIEFPVDYPYEPPNVKFETKIYHPNVGEEGQIHLNVLGEQWSPALTTEILLLSISSILLDPLLLDPDYPFLLEDTENPLLLDPDYPFFLEDTENPILDI